MKLDALVRPLITLGLALLQGALAVMWAIGVPFAESAFAGLGAFTMIALVYWFRDRSEAKAQAKRIGAEPVDG